MLARRTLAFFLIGWVIVLSQSAVSDGELGFASVSQTIYTEQEDKTAGLFSTRTWHHDCSNLTGFVQQSDNSWALMDEYDTHNVAAGALASSGSYIYPTAFGSGVDWYGPFYSRNLPN